MGKGGNTDLMREALLSNGGLFPELVSSVLGHDKAIVNVGVEQKVDDGVSTLMPIFGDGKAGISDEGVNQVVGWMGLVQDGVVGIDCLLSPGPLDSSALSVGGASGDTASGVWDLEFEKSRASI